MLGAIDPLKAPNGAVESQEVRQSLSPGPLFKEIYAGLIDVGIHLHGVLC